MTASMTPPRIVGGLLSYRVKVSQKRGAKNLWGGGGIDTALTGTDLFLFVRVDDHGEEITLKAKPTPHTPEDEIGTLAPGECFLVPLDNAVLISAACNNDTYVDCAIVRKK